MTSCDIKELYFFISVKVILDKDELEETGLQVFANSWDRKDIIVFGRNGRTFQKTREKLKKQ